MQFTGTMILDLDDNDSSYFNGRAAINIYSDYYFHVLEGQGEKISLQQVLQELYLGRNISYSEEKMKERSAMIYGAEHFINIIDIANDWDGRLGDAKDDAAMVYELVKRGELFLSPDGEYFFELQIIDDEEFIGIIDYYLTQNFEQALGDSLFLTDTADMVMNSITKMRYAFKYNIDPDEFNPELGDYRVTHVGVFIEQGSHFESWLNS